MVHDNTIITLIVVNFLSVVVVAMETAEPATPQPGEQLYIGFGGHLSMIWCSTIPLIMHKQTLNTL